MVDIAQNAFDGRSAAAIASARAPRWNWSEIALPMLAIVVVFAPFLQLLGL
jgi:hypothetical protein